MNLNKEKEKKPDEIEYVYRVNLKNTKYESIKHKFQKF